MVLITGWADLARNETRILTTVAAERFGAHRFLVDPVRFLAEVGFRVSEAFACELNNLPGVRATPKDAYDEIMVGRHRACGRRLTIDTLGIPIALTMTHQTESEP